MNWTHRGVAALAGLFVSIAHAHPDDPKLRDRKPRDEGRGWRQSDGGAPRVGFDASGVALMSWLTLPELDAGATNANDCWGYTSPSGREYALIGLSSGTAFVEITDPGNPSVVGFISGPESLWRDVQVFGTTAYAVSEGGSGIQVINLADIDNGTVNLIRTVTNGGNTTATHTVIVDEVSGYLYRCGGGSNGLRIYDLNADPTNPAFVTQWNNKYVHECAAVTYDSGTYAGKQIAFACNGFNGGFDDTGLEILDVTNKTAITTMSRITWSNPGYSHQVWLSEDRQYAFINDELDESNYGIGTRIIVINIANLSAPFIAATYTSTNPAIGHNFYVKGDLLFGANYTSGLRVYDISDPLAITETAYFDTFAGGDGATFNSLWGNYPYFPSGTVIGSDLEQGLFVWKVAPFEFEYPDGIPTTINPAGTTVRFNINPLNGGALEPGSVQAFVDTGSGFVANSVSDLGNGEFSTTLTGGVCGETLRFYVSAESTDGLVLSDPPAAPGSFYSAPIAFGITTEVEEIFETAAGWVGSAAGDNAATGRWTRVNPVGTSAQPEDDHSASGTFCWVTGQGSAGGGVGDQDVDGGTTTLVSATYDLTPYDDPRIGYWRWYNNVAGAAPNSDTFVIDISNNDGASWVNVEVVGPTGSETAGGWIYHEFNVADFVTPTNQVKLRFVASDLGDGSIVEAAIDDFQITTPVCETCASDLNGDLVVDLADLGIVLSDFGCVSACVGDLTGDDRTDLSDLGTMLAEFGANCP